MLSTFFEMLEQIQSIIMPLVNNDKRKTNEVIQAIFGAFDLMAERSGQPGVLQDMVKDVQDKDDAKK